MQRQQQVRFGTITHRSTGTGLANYTITYATGNLTVNPALTITASAQSKTYGTTLSLGTTAFTTSTLYGSDTVTGVTLTSAGAAATATVAGSPYTITPSAATGSGLSNYTITYATGNLTVNPATLTAGLTGTVSKTYNATNAATLTSGNYTLTGVVNGDTVNLNDPTSGTYASVNVGTGINVTVTGLAISGSGAGNYVLGSTTATGAVGTITAAPLTITASAQSKTYGTALSLGTTAFTSSGLQNGQTIGGVTLTTQVPQRQQRLQAVHIRSPHPQQQAEHLLQVIIILVMSMAI